MAKKNVREYSDWEFDDYISKTNNEDFKKQANKYASEKAKTLNTFACGGKVKKK